MAVDMRHPQSPVRWLLRPRDRDTLVETYQLAETLVLDETARHEVLMRAFHHYTLLVINCGVMCEREGRLLIERVERLGAEDADVVRSALFRLNCQLLRLVASMPHCNQACCCDCKARLPGLVCTVEVNRLRQPDDGGCGCACDIPDAEEYDGGRDN